MHVQFLLFAVYENLNTLFKKKQKKNMSAYAWKLFLGLNFISLYKLQAEAYNTHYNNNTEHLHNRDSEESENDFCNLSPR